MNASQWGTIELTLNIKGEIMNVTYTLTVHTKGAIAETIWDFYSLHAALTWKKGYIKQGFKVTLCRL